MILAALIDQNTLHPAGPQAARIAHLWWVFVAVCTAVYVIVIAFVFVAWARGRRRTEPVVSEEHDHRLGTYVAAAGGATAVALVILLVSTIATGSAIGHFANADVAQMEVEVTGHQWWWEVKYPNPIIPAYQIT